MLIVMHHFLGLFFYFNLRQCCCFEQVLSKESECATIKLSEHAYILLVQPYPIVAQPQFPRQIRGSAPLRVFIKQQTLSSSYFYLQSSLHLHYEGPITAMHDVFALPSDHHSHPPACT